ncbi:MAG: class I SAM-dependent methyltransferase, partial [Acidimicrobiales bacterium]
MGEVERLETGAAEFPRATWMSFDRYSRYGAVQRLLRANLGQGHLKVLEVGDSAGYLQQFDGEVSVVCTDLSMSQDPLADTIRTVADGGSLPFGSGAFDAVTAVDVFEHVPAAARQDFLKELIRVTRDILVLAAPFNTPGVWGAETFVRHYAFMAMGKPQDQLEEHRAAGLPDLAETISSLSSAG